jgi:hypothetical protein
MHKNAYYVPCSGPSKRIKGDQQNDGACFGLEIVTLTSIINYGGDLIIFGKWCNIWVIFIVENIFN